MTKRTKELDPFNTLTAGRQELFEALMPMLSGNDITDVICALCDHLAMSVAFASETQEEAIEAMGDLLPVTIETIKRNWAISRRSRLAAMAAGGPHNA